MNNRLSVPINKRWSIKGRINNESKMRIDLSRQIFLSRGCTCNRLAECARINASNA